MHGDNLILEVGDRVLFTAIEDTHAGGAPAKASLFIYTLPTYNSFAV